MQVRARCIGGGTLVWVLILVILLLAVAPAWAQNGMAKKLVSLDFVAADIHDVLKALSVQSGINVVAGNDVKGLVTISLSNVTLGEALDYITKVSGLSYQLVGNAYIVAPQAALRSMFGTKDQITEVIPVPNGQAAQIQPIAIKAVPDSTVQAQGDTNLVICGSPEDIQKIRDLVTKLDTRVKPTESEVTETYRIKYLDPKSAMETLAKLVPQVRAVVGPSYGFSWYVKSNTGGGASGGDDKPKMDSDLLVLTGYPSAIAKAREVLAKIDTSPVQLLVEAKVLVVDRSDLNSMGVKWSWDSTNWRAAGDGGDGTIQFGHLPGSPNPFFAQLDASITNGKSRLLASPKIATLSNRPADIFIGDTVLYPVTQISSSGVPTVTVEKVDVGIGLKLAATSNDDGHITLCISTFVSTIRDYLKVGESMFPQISTRQAETAVRVKDGEPILIGGLLRDEDIKNVKRIPLLSDLPFFGQLFRNSQVNKKQTEIMVFLTPRLSPDGPMATIPAELASQK